MKKDVYAYEYGDKKYLNLTNQCNNDCDFCIRKNPVGIEGYDLWLSKEPTAHEVIAQLDEIGRGDVVFCGYGEPTMRLDVLKEVASYVKSYGGKVRVNTNGLANRLYGRNVAPELADLVDVMSISLNEATAEKYQAICHSQYGAQAFTCMLDFAKACVEAGIETVLTVVDVISQEDIKRCQELAQETGAQLRVRHYSSK